MSHKVWLIATIKFAGSFVGNTLYKDEWVHAPYGVSVCEEIFTCEGILGGPHELCS